MEDTYELLKLSIEADMQHGVLRKEDVRKMVELIRNNELPENKREEVIDFIERVDKYLKNQLNKQKIEKVLNDIENSDTFDSKNIDFIVSQDKKGQLSKEQKERFNLVLKRVSRRENLPIKPTENILMKIPGIRKIIETINKFKNRKNEEKGNNQSLSQNNETNKTNKFNKRKNRTDFVQKVDIKPELFVVSDLHGDINRWNKVKEQLEQHPNRQFIIEGDAMDKGEYGIDILLQIKELSDAGRVHYLPGNHDEFLYDYVKTKDTNYTDVFKFAESSLKVNHGESTIRDIEKFDEVVDSALNRGVINKKIDKNELIDWLGKCPIQRTVHTKEQKYALSHAVFDMELYKKDRDFNLEKALDLKTKDRNNEQEDLLKRFKNCLWYREKEQITHFVPISWPEDYVVVVGHTRNPEINIQNFEDDTNKPIIYIDCKNGNFQAMDLTNNKSVNMEETPKEQETRGRSH